jgi:hypothetical protein
MNRHVEVVALSIYNREHGKARPLVRQLPAITVR